MNNDYKQTPSGLGHKKANKRLSFSNQDKDWDKDDPEKPKFKTWSTCIPSVKSKRVCYPNLSAYVCPYGESTCIAKKFVHFIPKDTNDEATRTAFMHYFGPFKAELS